MEPGMRRYWFEFETPPVKSPPDSVVDGPDSALPAARIRAGVGVTGEDAEDCQRQVRQRILRGAGLPPVRRIVEDVDVSTLGDEVASNMEVPIWRGIWFPRGFVEDTHVRS